MEKNLRETGTMTDRFDRTIDYLRVSVTDRCNLKCIYCMPKNGVRLSEQSELLTLDEILRIVGAAHRLGVKKVRITGGEPLLRPDIIPLLTFIKKRIGIRDLSLTTNGMLLPGMASELRAAGLDRVNISLDTLDSARFRMITRGGSLSRVWDAIQAAETAGLSPIKINVVVMAGINEDEITDFARLTRDRDIHVRFIEQMPVGSVGRTSRIRGVSAAEMMARIADLGMLSPIEFRGRGPSRNYRLSGARGVIGFISPISDHFCGCCNRLRLTATGMIKPCLFSSAGIDVKTAMRAGANDEELDSLMSSAAAVKPRGSRQASRTALHAPHSAMSSIGG